MSGGVDSSVAALLLKQRGYDVIGVTMQIWQESQTDPRHAGCCSLGAVEDARRVCAMLDIPYYVINFKQEFREAVINEFIDEYERGRTPNPCVTCNRKVKFEALLEKAQELGCPTLATGHYARIRRTKDGHRLLRARGDEKDQSYVLYGLTQEQMSRLWFPLGELPDKSVTRRLAWEAGLPVAGKPDSQEICFVSEAGGYREFLRKHRPEMFQEGALVDSSGEEIARHEGVADFTVGQRRGLGVAKGKPLYVLGLEPKKGRVTVGTKDELARNDIALEEMNWSAIGESDLPMRVTAMIRSNMDPQPARLLPGPKLVFDDPVFGVSPGQIAVAFRGKTVVAGGKIASTP